MPIVKNFQQKKSSTNHDVVVARKLLPMIHTADQQTPLSFILNRAYS